MTHNARLPDISACFRAYPIYNDRENERLYVRTLNQHRQKNAIEMILESFYNDPMFTFEVLFVEYILISILQEMSSVCVDDTLALKIVEIINGKKVVTWERIKVVEVCFCYDYANSNLFRYRIRLNASSF